MHAVLLSDQVAGRGYFALVTAASVLGNYSLVQPGGAPMVLAGMAPPQAIDVNTTPLGLTAVTARVSATPGGTYLDARCSSGLIVGSRVYVQKVSRGGRPPTCAASSSPAAGAWPTVGRARPANPWRWAPTRR